MRGKPVFRFIQKDWTDAARHRSDVEPVAGEPASDELEGKKIMGNRCIRCKMQDYDNMNQHADPDYTESCGPGPGINPNQGSRIRRVNSDHVLTS